MQPNRPPWCCLLSSRLALGCKAFSRDIALLPGARARVRVPLVRARAHRTVVRKFNKVVGAVEMTQKRSSVRRAFPCWLLMTKSSWSLAYCGLQNNCPEGR